MKTYKYFTLIMASLSIASCSNDDIIGETDNNQNNGKQANFISLIEENYSQFGNEELDNRTASTRATLDLDNLDAIWQTGDKVAITDGTLTYTYKVREQGHTCSFDVIDENHKGLEIAEGAKFYAFYPKDAISGWNGSKVSSMIYTEQKYEENYSATEDLSKQTFGGYMAAKEGKIEGENVTFSFNLVSSVVDVNLANLGINLSTVESVSIKANAGESIAGAFTYDCATKAMTVSKANTGYTTSGQSDVISVYVRDKLANGATGEAAYVRFYTLPVVVSQGFTITVKTTDGTYYTKSSSTSVGEGSSVTITGADNGTACKPYYKRLGFGAASKARTGCWMSTVPSNTHFNMLSLPGAHDAATSSCSSAAKCQQYTLADQLTKGVRAFDIRPGVNSSNLTIYHGGVSTNVTFASALNTFCTFLDNNPTETVFLLIKPEKSSLTGSASANDAWKTGVASALTTVSSHIAMIPSGNGTLTLGDSKGKMVVIAAEQTTADAGNIGVGRVGWGSSYNDKTVMKGVDNNGNFAWTLVYQDEYETAASKRLPQLEAFLNDYIAKNETNYNRIYFNGANCSSSIESSANTVNSDIVNSGVFKNSTGRWGIVSFDFCGYPTDNGDKLLNMIISQNHKYLYRDHTRRTTVAGTGTGVEVAGDEYADKSTVYARKR